MQYHSPFKIIPRFLLNKEELKNVDFSTIKKRILVEFELTGQTSITIDGKEFSKNDVIQIFDSIKVDKNFEFHLLISEIPGLLNLLEGNELDKELSFYDPRFTNEDFVLFLSPYLAESLGSYLSTKINGNQPPKNFGLHGKFPILVQHAPLLIKPVSEAINRIITNIENTCNYFIVNQSFPDTTNYFSNYIVQTIAILPSCYFSAEIELYTRCGINLIKHLIRSTKNGRIHLKTAKFIQTQLLKLKLNQELRQMVESIRIPKEEYFETVKTEKTENSSGTGKFIFFIIFILFTVIRLSLKDSAKQNSYDMDRLKRNEEIQDLIRNSKRLLDTSYKLPEVTVKPQPLDSSKRKKLKNKSKIKNTSNP